MILKRLLAAFGIGLLATTAQAANCPAYPQFPDANCTGYVHTGVTLTAYTGSMTPTSGTTIDSKLITGTLFIGANNITVTRSKIVGQIIPTVTNLSGVLIEDVEVAAPNIGGGGAGQCIGGNSADEGGATAAGFVLRRLDISGCTQGVYGRGFTLEDSYIHDLWATGADHTEAILGHEGDIVIRHNYLYAAYKPGATTTDGMSAVIALYSHSAFWADIHGATVERNYLKTADSGNGQAGYCMYGGNSGDATGDAFDTIYKDNVFDRGSTNICGWAGPIVWVPTGGNNCSSNNRYSDGTAISFSPNAACPASPAQPGNFRTN